MVVMFLLMSSYVGAAEDFRDQATSHYAAAAWFAAINYAAGFYVLLLDMGVLPSKRMRAEEPDHEHTHYWWVALIQASLCFVLWAKLGWFPKCYYDAEEPASALVVFAILLLVDAYQTLFHVLSHRWPILKRLHNDHHNQANPRAYDAAQADRLDALALLVAPTLLGIYTGAALGLPVTLHNWVTALTIWTCHMFLVHSEYEMPYDWFLRDIGFVTTADHHVHHVLPNRNMAHQWTYWDRLMGTYVDPRTVPGIIVHE